jgi:hypothetical protein
LKFGIVAMKQTLRFSNGAMSQRSNRSRPAVIPCPPNEEQYGACCV